ncbi:MAG: glycosyltransferase [Lachnospiraceae bacterium]|nr:glycosyltransferase [Lachnospiraceae bacterium]
MCRAAARRIRHGENGWIIPAGDEDALKKAMDTLLSDRELAEKFGAEAHKIQERLAPDKVNEQWRAYFEQLIG